MAEKHNFPFLPKILDCHLKIGKDWYFKLESQKSEFRFSDGFHNVDI